jgi:hypothetical protein
MAAGVDESIEQDPRLFGHVDSGFWMPDPGRCGGASTGACVQVFGTVHHDHVLDRDDLPAAIARTVKLWMNWSDDIGCSIR